VNTDPDMMVPRAAIPADVEAPDKLIYNLTARQVAILATAAILGYGLFKTLLKIPLPLPAAAAAIIPIIGVATAVALGRRDGVSLDRWFLAAILHRRTPKRQVPAPDGVAAAPDWAPVAVANPGGRQTPPTVLRLPAQAITDTGVIDLGGGTAATMVAATTINIGLRTGEEQAALLGAYGRWLNSLSGPVQVAVSAQRVDLSSHAQRIADTAAALADPALADAALDYGEFLLDLAADRDPLWRTVTIVCTATGSGAPGEAARRGEYTASALSALGVDARVLDGATATAVLAAAVDPYQYTDASWPRTVPTTPIGGRAG
jgi:PrgI family protein